MNRKAKVFVSGHYAGVLEERSAAGSKEFRFIYDTDYLLDPDSEPVSLTLPKRREPYKSSVLFPFFHGLLAEGRMKELQCRALRIDENDHFGRLIKTAGGDSIGAVSVREEVDE